MYMYIDTYVCIHMYTYIKREREREKESKTTRKTDASARTVAMPCADFVGGRVQGCGRKCAVWRSGSTVHRILANHGSDRVQSGLGLAWS